MGGILASGSVASGLCITGRTPTKPKCWEGLVGTRVRITDSSDADCAPRENPNDPTPSQSALQCSPPPESKTGVPTVTPEDLPVLQAQAARLRYTIQRRLRCAGVNAEGDDVPAIVSHYRKVLSEIEEQIKDAMISEGAPEADVDAAEKSSASFGMGCDAKGCHPSPCSSRPDSFSTTCSHGALSSLADASPSVGDVSPSVGDASP